ncbi:MAG: acyl-CoA thioesterase [Geminocystis sp.]|nr:acyl-CoA thioesterase [Geminocystis sp.]HIK37261.1 acyl-CoA thioesterase [Geminocystis sp. M7585_C2015_104]MCS7148218.1 acyl-CoA thioesterase [Geminocystis sp.]MCX8077632.1 acyl-CoA thioesterase [Geminocystis sp.]MDW8116524.1 thioesterase family protein [Geminocystis sp.]
MTEKPQLSPSQGIGKEKQYTEVTEKWFEYPIVVHPHHTDYAGVVWHGVYLTWMEEARIECLRQLGIDYAQLVALGYELPVIEVNLRYHRPLRMGDRALVKTKVQDLDGVKIHWDYQITDWESSILYVSGRVTLVGIDREKGKIMRKLPTVLQEALVKL